MICLPKNLATKFAKALKSKKLNLEELLKPTVSSEARRQAFTKVVGEQYAQELNGEIEKVFLLKDQKRGLTTYARKVLGLNEARTRDLLSRVDRMQDVLQPPKREDGSVRREDFLEDFAAIVVGTEVTLEEGGKVVEMAKLVSDKKKARKDSEDAALEYGNAFVAFHNYVNDISKDNRTLSEKVRENPAGSFLGAAVELLRSSRTMKTTLDDSYPGRQGLFTAFSHPVIWAKQSAAGFSQITKTLKGEEVLDATNAYIVSRDLAVDGTYKKAGLAVSTAEEAVPTQLPEKLPLVGRFIKAADVTFTAQAWLTRVDLFDLYYAKAKDAGVNLNDKENLKGIGGMVNSMTGRGSLGKLEPIGDILNVGFFSPRLLTANIQVFTQPFTGAQKRGGFADKGDFKATNFVRKQAGINIMKAVISTAAVLVGAMVLLGDDAVDLEPTSSGFGQIKIGNTFIDITGGKRSIIILAARFITGKSTSSLTGITTKLNEPGFMARNKLDVLIDFTENKLAPVAATLKNLFFTGENFEGAKPTVITTLRDLYVPIPIENFLEMQDDPDSVNTIVGAILDGFGFGTNTYSISNNWNNNMTEGSSLDQFKTEVGQEDFDIANEQFNRMYIDWYKRTSKEKDFIDLEDKDKKAVISKKKKEFKKDVFDDYNFKKTKADKKNLPKF